MADNRRERRPLGQHAGEVTKKKNRYATNDGYGQVAPLPPPSASQNGRSRHHNSRLGPGASINGDDNPDEDSGVAKPLRTPAEQRAKYLEYAEMRTKDSYHSSEHDKERPWPNSRIPLYGSTHDSMAYSPMYTPQVPFPLESPGRSPTQARIRATAQRVPGLQLALNVSLDSHNRMTGAVAKGTFGAKRQEWRRGRVEAWDREGLVIPVYALCTIASHTLADLV
jgi:hypothetical protein